MRLLNLSLIFSTLLLIASCAGGGAGVQTDSGTATADAVPAGSLVTPQPEAPSSLPAPASGRFIVALQASGARGASAVNRMTAALQTPPDQIYDKALTGFAGELTAAEVVRLKADPAVQFVEPDITLYASGQLLGWGVNRVDADLNTRWTADSGGTGIGVAIFDTGMDVHHPDLAGAVLASYNATGAGTITDANGHGTHVAGIVGARRNTLGYVGVAPACKLINVKVLGDDGSGQLSSVIAGINWVLSRRAYYNIKVANMSFGAPGSSTALETAINNAVSAGIVIVAAAGNEHVDAGTVIPAKYANVICVSALNSNGSFASYSNFGSVVDITAPGTGIPSLWKGHGYAASSGTSMAAPHVAGALALWYDNHSGGPAAALAALQAAGESGNWAGDPDSVREKLLDAQGL